MHQISNMANTHLKISTATELLRIHAKHIIYISSDGNYSNIVLQGGDVRMVTIQLGKIEEMIQEQLPDLGSLFIRIGKSLIINVNNVFLINVPKQQLVLTDNSQGKYTLSPSKEALKSLKEYIEKENI